MRRTANACGREAAKSADSNASSSIHVALPPPPEAAG
jgi:hypothetical protein